MVKTGRPPVLTIEDKENLKALAVGNPLLTLRELHALFSERHRITISLATMWHCLTGMGLTRPKTFGSHAPTRAHPNVHTPNLPPPPAPAHQPHHYGYQKEHRYQPPAPQYPSSLTDAEWALVADLFDHPGPGHPPKFSRRQILDACRYVMRAGCSWRMLPHDFPPWATVYAVFKRWSRKGLFEQMHERLRQMYRPHEGKSPHPSAALLDSQTVKTGPQGGEKGFDAGKKTKGRKRHLATDFLGLLLAVVVLPANIQDRDAVVEVATQAKRKQPTIEAFIADGAYTGECGQKLEDQLHARLEIVKRPNKRTMHQDGAPVATPQKGFVLLPKRWIIERTNAWNLRFRRLVMDYERDLHISASWIWLAESSILLRRFFVS